MKYSDRLIEKIKELYPNSGQMHYHAEHGNIILGRWLQDSIPTGFTVQEVLQARSLDVLITEARVILQKQALYDLWCQEVYNNRQENKS